LSTETMRYYGTTGFYTLQAFQWHIICNFSSCKLKDMEFTKFSWKQIQNSNLYSIWIGSRHVERYYSPLPVRSDRELRPSDLKRSGQIRSSSTPSSKWICLRRTIKIWRLRLKGEKGSPRVRVPGRRRRGLRTGGETLPGSGGFQQRRSSRRGAARRGDLGSVIAVLERFP
jgi:hypothetical protein